jgi:hypothetical protein
MPLTNGDLVVYDGSKWVNQQSVPGKFGVGTTSPTETLHVVGRTRLQHNATNTELVGTDHVYMAFYPQGLATGRFGFFGYNAVNTNHLVLCNERSTGRLELWTNTTSRLAIDASGNVGLGTTSPNSLLQVNGPIATAVAAKTAAYTVTAADSLITGDATSAAFTITLPTAVGITGRQYTIKKVDSSGNAVTVGTTSSQTIDGAATDALGAQWKYVTVVSNGSNWLVTANN